MTEQSKAANSSELPEAVLDVFKKYQQNAESSNEGTAGGTWVPNECWRVCPCCGRHLEWGWTYCPSCGCWVFHYPCRPCYPVWPTNPYPYQPTYQPVWVSAGNTNCPIPCAY